MDKKLRVIDRLRQHYPTEQWHYNARELQWESNADAVVRKYASMTIHDEGRPSYGLELYLRRPGKRFERIDL